jgi:radical SAM-linked protein
MVQDKVRIRFRKGGDLRFVSHHDLMRCFERMLRRARLPFHSTSGFNPKPRLVFALSLPLGIVGDDEIADLELDETVPPDEVHQRLAAQAPAGLAIRSVCRIGTKESARVRAVRYSVPLPKPHGLPLEGRIEALLRSSECWVERTRPQRRRVNLRPFIGGVSAGDGILEMELIVTEQGTARPEEILRLLDLALVIDAGAIIKRTAIVLAVETNGNSETSANSASRIEFGNNGQLALSRESRMAAASAPSAEPRNN